MLLNSSAFEMNTLAGPVYSGFPSRLKGVAAGGDRRQVPLSYLTQTNPARAHHGGRANKRTWKNKGACCRCVIGGPGGVRARNTRAVCTRTRACSPTHGAAKRLGEVT